MSRVALLILVICTSIALVSAIILTIAIQNPSFLASIELNAKKEFVTSLWGDIFFFLTVGIGIFLAEKFDKEPHSFKSRMKSIFGNVISYTNNLHGFIEIGFRDLLAYFEIVDVNIQFMSIDKENNLVELQILRNLVVGNLSKDTVAEHRLWVNLDPESCTGGKDTILYDIESAEIDQPTIEYPNDRCVVFSGKTASKKIDDYVCPFKIPIGKYRWYRYAIRTWENVGVEPEIYEILQRRYCRNFKITILNSTDVGVKIASITDLGSTDYVVDRRNSITILPNVADNAESFKYKLSVTELI